MVNTWKSEILTVVMMKFKSSGMLYHVDLQTVTKV